MTHAATARPASKTTPLADRYLAVRRFTNHLCDPLSPEDCTVQSMPDASPTRWHLAHTTWFFETFLLQEHDADYRPYHEDFSYLFNSYYNTVGEQYPRPQRGVISRPSLGEVFAYRDYVDEAMTRLLRRGVPEKVAAVVITGLHHEQQHQELILTDIKHALAQNPLYPAYQDQEFDSARDASAPDLTWSDYEEGLYEIGCGRAGFSFDNERPPHLVYCGDFELADRLITCGEYRLFVEDDGYRRPELWPSLGWQQVCEEKWQAPLYWTREDGRWRQFTLGGLRDVCDHRPVTHVSFFEASAFAAWAGFRLPTEAEWEIAAAEQPVAGNFVESGALHPLPATGDARPEQLFGDAWEWTTSAHSPYPGYRAPEGALGEYNGKFMCNQYVLRGGSCATPQSHIRPTYRNFFPPQARWQFSGIRLARDV